MRNCKIHSEEETQLASGPPSLRTNRERLSITAWPFGSALWARVASLGAQQSL